MFNFVTKPRAISYNGRVCDFQEYCVSQNRWGSRISVRRWRDNGKVELRAIQGDGRTFNFRLFGTDVLEPGAAPEYVVARAHAMVRRYWSTRPLFKS